MCFVARIMTSVLRIHKIHLTKIIINLNLKNTLKNNQQAVYTQNHCHFYALSPLPIEPYAHPKLPTAPCKTWPETFYAWL